MSKKRHRNRKTRPTPGAKPDVRQRRALMSVAIPADVRSALPSASVAVLRSYVDMLLARPTGTWTDETTLERTGAFAGGEVKKLVAKGLNPCDCDALRPFFFLGLRLNGIAVEPGVDAAKDLFLEMNVKAGGGLAFACFGVEERLRTLEGDLTELRMSDGAVEIYRAMFEESSLTVADLVETAKELERL